MKAVRVLNDVYATDPQGTAQVVLAAGTVLKIDDGGDRQVALRNGEEIEVADDYFDAKTEAAQAETAAESTTAAGAEAGTASDAAGAAGDAAAGADAGAEAASEAAADGAAPTTKSKKAAAAA